MSAIFNLTSQKDHNISLPVWDLNLSFVRASENTYTNSMSFLNISKVDTYRSLFFSQPLCLWKFLALAHKCHKDVRARKKHNSKSIDIVYDK